MCTISGTLECVLFIILLYIVFMLTAIEVMVKNIYTWLRNIIFYDDDDESYSRKNEDKEANSIKKKNE